MLKKLIVVTNPAATKYRAVEREVLAVTRKLSGWLVGRYEVQSGPFAQNVAQLSKLLQDGDLVVSVGGDGTASLTVNAILSSGKQVTYSCLGYGDFNDVARMLKTKRAVEYGDEYVGGISEIIERFEQGKLSELYPLEVQVNGELYRYALCYFTMGLLAEATQVFDEPKVRARLQARRRNLLYSWWQLGFWYLKHRRQRFLPNTAVTIDHVPIGKTAQPEMSLRLTKETTDYLAINSPRVVGILKGHASAKKAEGFASAVLQLSNVKQMAGFVFKGVLAKVPARKTLRDHIDFAQPAAVMVQADGEFERLEDVNDIEVRKAGQPLKVVRN